MGNWDADSKTSQASKQAVSGQASAQSSSVTAKTTRYKLRAHRTSDDTWQTWTDTSVSVANAPGGSANYDAASLVVQGTY